MSFVAMARHTRVTSFIRYSIKPTISITKANLLTSELDFSKIQVFQFKVYVPLSHLIIAKLPRSMSLDGDLPSMNKRIRPFKLGTYSLLL